MKMDLTEFNLKRDIIRKYYSNLLEIAEKLKDERLFAVVEQFLESLKQDSFNIVIIGEFARGKSTFINALLGKRILPAATKPTTIIINKISYGKESEFNLHFRESKDIKKINEEEFKDITAKSEPCNYNYENEVNEYNENLKLISSIAHVDIKYPIEICKEGIEIIDTPGTNDLDQAREEITFDFIPKSDIVILLLSADQILSQSEVNFLKERILDNDIKKVFFVINFKDRLSSKEDEDKVISYAKEHLQEIIDNPRIFMVSARQALNFKRKEKGEVFKEIIPVPETLKETGFDEIEKAITNYLINERGPIKLKKYVHEGSKLADELLNNMINAKLQTVDLEASELEKRFKEATQQDVIDKVANTMGSINTCAKPLVQEQSTQAINFNPAMMARIKELTMLMNEEINQYNREVKSGLNPSITVGSINRMQKEYKNIAGQGIKVKVANDENAIKNYEQRLVQQQSINNSTILARIQELKMLMKKEIDSYNALVNFGFDISSSVDSINRIQKKYKNLTGQGIKIKVANDENAIKRYEQQLVQQISINNAIKLIRIRQLMALMDKKIIEYNNQVQFGLNTKIIDREINDIQIEYRKLIGQSIKVEVVNINDSIDCYEQILLQQQSIDNANKLARAKELRVLMDEKLIEYRNQVEFGLNTNTIDGEINDIQKEYKKLTGEGIKVEVVNTIESISSCNQPLFKQYNNIEIKSDFSTSVQPKVITAEELGRMMAKSLINVSPQQKSINKYDYNTLAKSQYPIQPIVDTNATNQQIVNSGQPTCIEFNDLKSKSNQISNLKNNNISTQPQASIKSLFELFPEFSIGNENNVEIPKIEKNSDEDRILKEKQKNDEHFQDCLNKYNDKIAGSEVELALCYLKGMGITKDSKKAFSLLVEGAYAKSNNALQLLGDYYYGGYGEIKDTNKANYIYSLARGESPRPINQYKSTQIINFKKNNKNKEEIFHIERDHLISVIDSIKLDINGLGNSIKKLDRDTWWMDRDQREEWREQNFRNIEKRKKISDYEKIIRRPYYARMDSVFNGEINTYYIGEEAYIDHSNNSNSIVSVWSEYGQKYRAKNLHNFIINGYQYKIELRRQIEIRNGELIDIFDEYSAGSSASESQITDPYLIKVLEEKKGEGNITNIIRTIQLNQNDIIDYDFNKSLIVQGCAGSGKTMILLHRLANMKYNMKGLDLSKIKIITPNEQFNLFIDELSKNLKIETIDKMPLSLYYIELLGRYRLEKQQLYKKLVSAKNKNGNSIEVEENAWRTTGPTIEDEKQKICDEVTLRKELVEYIYSDKFAEDLKQNVIKMKNKYGSQLHYGELMNRFNESFEKTLSVINNIRNAVEKNYNCILYAKVLFMYEYYGPLIKRDSYLCIDEGQDISVLQYKLLQKVNSGKAIFNVYGDINQQIPSCIGIDDWSSCIKAMDAKYFVLNENYRNSDEIIKYYNKKLNFNNTPLGVKTKTVEYIEIKELVTYVKLQLLLKNRVAIIYNDSELILKEVKKYCVQGNIVNEKAALLTVKQAKGLEFDVVFVIQNNMTKNEKYIAFTRGLSELYIVK